MAGMPTQLPRTFQAQAGRRAHQDKRGLRLNLFLEIQQATMYPNGTREAFATDPYPPVGDTVADCYVVESDILWPDSQLPATLRLGEFRNRLADCFENGNISRLKVGRTVRCESSHSMAA